MNSQIDEFAVSSLRTGAVAILVVEDAFCLEESLFHNAKLGFSTVILVSKSRPEISLSFDTDISILWSPITGTSREKILTKLNELLNQLQGRWVYQSYNAEFLYFPFCEMRKIEDLARFMEEERRGHVYSYTVDLYNSQDDLSTFSRDDAHFDASGYYAMNRFEDGEVLDRQIEVFGGLKWRYSEHVPWDRQRIDRVPFFKVTQGLELDAQMRPNIAELNTHSCPWHHNVTCAIASYRTAKSLRRNPGSAAAIGSFMWAQSTRFEWTSAQLMDHGMIEPGQWF